MADVDRALLRHGVFVLARERRSQLASRLASLGSDASDIDGMASLINDGATEVMARRFLAGLLTSSDDRLRTAIEDVRRWSASRPAAAPAVPIESRATHPGEGDRAKTAARLAEERAQWPRQDAIARAHALAADGRSAEDIVACTGLDAAEVAEIVRPREEARQRLADLVARRERQRAAVAARKAAKEAAKVAEEAAC